jgi:steroid 5-alpha reductase family enzyme
MSYFIVLAVALFSYMNLWFLISLIKKRNDVADTAWGLGFVVMAWISFVISDSYDTLGILVSCLVSIWGLRLAWHVHSRNKNKPEDYRYQIWRREWGKWFYIRSYFQVFLLQGFFLFLISLPVLIINKSVGSDIGLIAIIGLLIWLVGFFFESVGDAQLKRFIKNPKNKGKLMQEGLWSYTRHPNYFGEVTQWWGIWLIALTVPHGLFGIIGPLTITFLILKVSGIPMLEKKMAENPEFKDYKNRVSIFLPLPPKNSF